MHQKLLSNKERQMLKAYLDTGCITVNFKVLKFRILKHSVEITQDYELIKKALERIEQSRKNK